MAYISYTGKNKVQDSYDLIADSRKNSYSFSPNPSMVDVGFSWAQKACSCRFGRPKASGSFFQIGEL
jgi:hypothetical protein